MRLHAWLWRALKVPEDYEAGYRDGLAAGMKFYYEQQKALYNAVMRSDKVKATLAKAAKEEAALYAEAKAEHEGGRA